MRTDRSTKRLAGRAESGQPVTTTSQKSNKSELNSGKHTGGAERSERLMEMKWEKGDVESSADVHSHNLFTHIHKQRLAPHPHPVHIAYVNCVKIIWAYPQPNTHTHDEEKSQCPISGVEAALAASHHVPLISKALKIYPNKTVSSLEINLRAKAKRADMVYISLAVKRTSTDKLDIFFSSLHAHTHSSSLSVFKLLSDHSA